MKLDQKYFIPFMVIVAIFTMIFMVISSFNFKERQKEQFTSYTLKYDSLLTKSHPYLEKQDSLKLGDLTEKNTILVFWSSWSEKSTQLLVEMDEVSKFDKSFNVVAALVKDATDSAEEAFLKHDFIYIDGTILFNELRVPGIPSYLVLDKNGNLLSTHVGFQKSEFSEVISGTSD